MIADRFDFEASKPIVLARQETRCLRCGEYLRPHVWPGRACHHRRTRRGADPEWRHSPANLVYLCGEDNSTGCHGWVHQHPEEAHGTGYYLRAGEDPRGIPVLDWRGRWLLLDDDGDWRTVGREGNAR